LEKFTKNAFTSARDCLFKLEAGYENLRNRKAYAGAACYTNSLKLALQYDCKRVAFPNISTGVYGYPKKQAASIAIQTVSNFLQVNRDELDEIIFVCFDEENYDLYQQELSGKSF
jgi:O-acetyl-ADP-ribose deacetylase (regulator of RNase III)